MNQHFYKNMALWVVILVMILLLVTMLNQTETETPPLSYSEFVTRIEQGEIESLEIEEGNITGVLTNGESFTTYTPVVSQELLDKLYAKSIKIDAQPKGRRLGGNGRRYSRTRG